MKTKKLLKVSGQLDRDVAEGKLPEGQRRIGYNEVATGRELRSKEPEAANEDLADDRSESSEGDNAI